MPKYTEIKLFFCFLLIFIPLISFTTFAKKKGITGMTNSNTKSCGECHSPSPNPNIVFSLKSDIDLNSIPTNTKVKFTLTGNYPSAMVSGVNIAVKNNINGAQNIGTLSPEINSGLKLQNGELTHSSPLSCTHGEIIYYFYWTSPQTEGTYYLQAAILMGNGNGKEDANDVWNWIQPVQLQVQNQPASVNNDFTNSSENLLLRFDASINKYLLVIPQEKISELNSIRIFNTQGKEIFTSMYQSPKNNNAEFFSIQETLPNGVYLMIFNFLKENYIEKFIINK